MGDVFIKTFAAIIACIIALGIGLAIFFPIITYNYACEGKIHPDFERELFVKYSRYRGWMIWTESDGEVFIEIEGNYRYFSNIRNTRLGTEIFNRKNEQIGFFSKLSGNLRIDTGIGFYSGICTLKNKE